MQLNFTIDKNKLFTKAVLLCSLLLLSNTSFAAAKTTAEVRNYSKDILTIEYRKVNLLGKVNWVRIGKISSKKSRSFRNITIGSVIRAKSGDKVVEVFKINAPRPNEKRVVLSVKPKR